MMSNEKVSASVVYRVRYVDAGGKTRSRFYKQVTSARDRAEALRCGGKKGVAIDVLAGVYVPLEGASLPTTPHPAPRAERSEAPPQPLGPSVEAIRELIEELGSDEKGFGTERARKHLGFSPSDPRWWALEDRITREREKMGLPYVPGRGWFMPGHEPPA